MSFRAIVASVAVLLFQAAAGYGDLIIDIGDLNLSPGGTGYVEVAISGTGTGQTLQNYAFDYRITRTSGVGRLEFVDPQPSYLTDSEYVFYNNSKKEELGVPVGGVSLTTLPNDTFIGLDLTADGNDVTVTSAKLLARLQVTAATTLPPQVGDTYAISLVSGTTSFFKDTSGSVNYTPPTPAGTVTISNPIPEPGSLVALLSGSLCLAGLGCYCSFRRRARRERAPRGTR